MKKLYLAGLVGVSASVLAVLGGANANAEEFTITEDVEGGLHQEIKVYEDHDVVYDMDLSNGQSVTIDSKEDMSWRDDNLGGIYTTFKWGAMELSIAHEDEGVESVYYSAFDAGEVEGQGIYYEFEDEVDKGEAIFSMSLDDDGKYTFEAMNDEEMEKETSLYLTGNTNVDIESVVHEYVKPDGGFVTKRISTYQRYIYYLSLTRGYDESVVKLEEEGGCGDAEEEGESDKAEEVVVVKAEAPVVTQTVANPGTTNPNTGDNIAGEVAVFAISLGILAFALKRK